jgi:hypothetical protein
VSRWATPTLKLRASGGRSYRPPAFHELYFVPFFGNPSLFRDGRSGSGSSSSIAAATSTTESAVREVVDKAVGTLYWSRRPGFRWLLDLIDAALVTAGLRLSPDLILLGDSGSSPMWQHPETLFEIPFVFDRLLSKFVIFDLVPYLLIGIQFRRALGQKEESQPSPMRSNPFPHLLRAVKWGLVYD